MPITLNQNPSAVEKGAVQKESLKRGLGHGLGGRVREAGLREKANGGWGRCPSAKPWNFHFRCVRILGERI